jgi:hypothetical protein
MPLAILVGAVLALAACGDDDDESTAAVVSGTGYEYTLPSGWTDALASDPAGAAATPVDSLATVDSEGTDLVTGVNVVTAPAPAGTTLEGFARGSARTVTDPATAPPGVTFTDPPSRPTTTELGGEAAMEFDHNGEYRRDGGASGELRQRQVVVLHDGSAYVVTFASFATPDRSFESDSADFQEIIDSWRWSS